MEKESDEGRKRVMKEESDEVGKKRRSRKT